MLNNNYNKNTLEAVTQGQVSGEPARSLDPFRLAKTTLILLVINNILLGGDLNIDSKFYDGIIYNTNDIVKASSNCEFGFCKAKVAEEPRVVYAIVVPECDKGQAELSKQKLK